MKCPSILAAVALSVLLGPVSDAQGQSRSTIYQWQDSRGNAVMSDRPPSDGTPYTVTSPGFKASPSPATKPSPTPAAKTKVQGEPSSARPQSSAMTTKMMIEKDPAVCEKARERKFSLETFARIRFTSDSGEVRFMTDEERAQRLQEALELIKTHCD